MKKLAIVFLSATLLSSTGFAADNVVATYKNGEVTDSQIMSQFKSILDSQDKTKNKAFNELDPLTQEQLVKSFVSMKMVEQEVKNQNIENNAEFKKQLNDIKIQLTQQKLLENYLKTIVTDAKVDKAYADYIDILRGQKEIKVAHILVATDKEAKEVKQKIKKDGSNFADIAKKFSTDESSKTSGGELGYIIKGQFVPTFEEKAFALKKKEVSDPVLTQFGYHIIKVLDERPAKLPTTDQEQKQTKEQLRAQLNQKAAEQYIKNLVDNANIQLSLPSPKEEKK